MFERADRLLDDRNALRSKHIISYYWSDFVPHLIAFDRSTGSLYEIGLDTLSMSVSEEKICVGSHDDDDNYHPCPFGWRVNTFSQCQRCVAPRIPVQSCVFEPRCNGDLCDHPEFCQRKHVIYLAFFGKLTKVGMTSARRLRTRGIEQGADAIAPILECNDRFQARKLERDVSKIFKVNQELRIKKVAAEWTVPVDRRMIEEMHASLVRRIGASKNVLQGTLEHLDGYPIFELPSSPPTPVRVPGRHEGKVLGIKGKYMIFRQKGSEITNLLDLSDLPSRFVTPI